MDAIFYLLSTRCHWNALLSDLPPRSTVWDYLDLWEWYGTIARINDTFYVEMRERSGCKANSSLAILEVQSVKGALKAGPRVTTPAKRCSGASATSSSIRKACS